MRLLGLLVLAAVTAMIGGAGSAFAAPAPTSPALPSVPGIQLPNQLPTSIDGVLDALSGLGLGSSDKGTPQAGNQKSDQMVVVTAPKASETTGTLTAFERGADNKWKAVVGPTKAYLGSQGMGEPKDNVPRTPEGTFPLNQAFGREANPGTKMPYFKATREDWWDSNMKSPTYNTHVHQAKSPGGDSENLYDSGPVYDYAVNIDHNPSRTPGKASAMFLHVANGQPTQGCVAIARDEMKKVLQWLDPAKHPKIAIGVNQSKPPADNAQPSTTPSTQPGATTTPTTPNARPTTPNAQPTSPNAQPGTTTSPGATTTPTTPSDTGSSGGDLLSGLLTTLVDLVPTMLGSLTGSSGN